MRQTLCLTRDSHIYGIGKKTLMKKFQLEWMVYRGEIIVDCFYMNGKSSISSLQNIKTIPQKVVV